MTDLPEDLLIVENLKQALYCRRIVFYERCMPGIRPRTYQMDVGAEDHLDARQNARRRTLEPLAIEIKERHFDVDIIDAGLRLHGKLDEVVLSTTGEYLPVEYKSARKLTPSHRIQVAAYALLLEREHKVAVTRALIYLIPMRKTQIVKVTEADKQQVEQVLAEVRAMVTTEQMPDPTPERSRCAACEFRRFCNDV